MIVILTALPSEFAAVRAHLTDVEVRKHRAGTLFEVGKIARRPDREVAVAVIGAGNSTAASLTERAAAEFAPAAMLFVGVAGGLRDWLELGDVVVATRVHAIHGGRSEEDEFLVRPRTYEAPHDLEQAARMLARSDEWRAPLSGMDKAPAPLVHFEAIAAGEVLLNAKDSPLARHLRQNYNDAVAVEMEGAGFALAGHLNVQVPSLVIRGISDRAGGHKQVTDSQGWQPVAARNAAAFAVALAAAFDDFAEPDEDRASEKTTALPPIRNKNVARGNARVGQQIGVNLGGQWNQPPAGGSR